MSFIDDLRHLAEDDNPAYVWLDKEVAFVNQLCHELAIRSGGALSDYSIKHSDAVWDREYTIYYDPIPGASATITFEKMLIGLHHSVKVADVEESRIQLSHHDLRFEPDSWVWDCVISDVQAAMINTVIGYRSNREREIHSRIDRVYQNVGQFITPPPSVVWEAKPGPTVWERLKK